MEAVEKMFSSSKNLILFPALSMLDVSGNRIASVPPTIHELANLSVLNLSRNAKINDLPPEMGLLYKLWNLNTGGCNLQEPLLTLTSSKSYKTSDVIGYLRSVLENSKQYARLKLMVVGIAGIGKTTLLELLRQESGSSAFRRKHPGPEHWAKRMGNKNIGMKTGRGGVSMSTVGVDIGDWTFEKRGPSGHGPVVFRTWDFGGQNEYYATHQYFLSKRSLYLVIWKMTDGEKGMNEMEQWLINIQARAPNSPVIIVGTHQDLVREEFPPSFSEYLQQSIRDKFINVADPEKCGLPRVLDTIEVSCKTRHNLRLLAHLLYDTAFSLKSPGGSSAAGGGGGGGNKTRMLEQKIPATYLALEDLVGVLSAELRAQGHDPVLNRDQFSETVNAEMEKRFGLRFRDDAELGQATKFLHENGLMLHYDDATLRDLYFLDPQWLCDVLSHVVTIREINPFAKNGVMRLEDLRHVFKSSTAVSVTAKSYIVNLLNKFEVALTWDGRTLLIPSLLPTEAMMRSGVPGMDLRVKIAVRTRGWGFRSRRQIMQNEASVPATSTESSSAGASSRSRSVPARVLLKDKMKLTRKDESTTGGGERRSRREKLQQTSVEGKGGVMSISRPIQAEPLDSSRDDNATSASGYEMSKRSESEHVIHRLLLMSYFPSGFWSRLLTRVLADDAVVEIVRSYFIVPEEMARDPVLARIFVEQRPEWVCWKTGLELKYMDSTLFSLKQVLSRVPTAYDYRSMDLVLYQEENWNSVDTRASSILEVLLPQDTVVIKRPVRGDGGDQQAAAIGYQAIVLDPNPKAVCQLLALAVEHIDTLLEDWYPSLGTRFLHTSEGKMLVTRLVPCPRCVAAHNERLQQQQEEGALGGARGANADWGPLSRRGGREAPIEAAEEVRVSQDSAASDKDSGVGEPEIEGEIKQLNRGA